MTARRINAEYDAFQKMTDKLLSVSHGEIKKKLDAEKQEKARKKTGKKVKP